VVGAVTALALTTDDGVRLAARWWRPHGDDGRGEAVAVVVVHGFCASQHAPAVELVALRQAAVGRRVLTVDLRGHGRSGGVTTLGHLERLDVDAAVQAARADHDRVVVVGSSMGGVATIDHLAAGPGAGVADGGVVVGTPARWRIPRSAGGLLAVALTQTRPGRAVAARRMGTRVATAPGRGAPPVERIAAVSSPVAVVHGLSDRFVSADSARALFAATPEPRRIDLVPGMGHGFCAAALDAVDAAVGWVVDEAAAARWHAPQRGRA
jgi:pimeloyl-ACP methyl ester carboxylesterase